MADVIEIYDIIIDDTIVLPFRVGVDGHSPYIGENGNWYQWSHTEEDYVDTGVQAHGVTFDQLTPEQILELQAPAIKAAEDVAELEIIIAAAISDCEEVVASGAYIVELGGDITAALSNKVDKVTGKGLSTEDFTTEEKSKLASVPDFTNVESTLNKVTSITEESTDIQYPSAKVVHTKLETKVDKVIGKGLSTEDYTAEDKLRLANTSGTNTGDQDLSGKVDRVEGKGLSTNDYTTEEKGKLEGIEAGAQVNAANTVVDADYSADKLRLANTSGINTGDQDLSGKVDKVTGKQLSTEDYSTAEKNKLSGIAEGANNYTHPTNHPPSIITQDENNRFVTDAEKGVWSGKQDALGFTPENVANKKTSITDSDTDYPSSKAVKTLVAAAVAQKSFYADTMTVNSGTLNQGTVADLDEVGGTDVIIQEASGADPLTVTFDFSDVTEVTSFVFYGEYVGGAMHQVYIEVYNYVSLAWDLKLIIGTEGSKKWYTAPIYNANAYLSEGAMQVRFRHIGNGISSHQLILDYVEINSGGSGGQTNISASSVSFLPSGNLSATDVASALVELDTEKVATSLVGAVSGLAQLDSTGKHKIEQYQDIILGQLKYGGTFDNDGLITSDYSTLNGQDIDLLLATDWKGFFFIFSGTTSTHHSIEFEAGDWLISNGTAGWAKIDNTDAVSLVNGKKGNVTLGTDDISEGATPTNKWFTEARVRASLLTGLSATNSAIAATDTVLQGFNKSQGQITDIVTKLNASALTSGYLPHWDGVKFVNSKIRRLNDSVTEFVGSIGNTFRITTDSVYSSDFQQNGGGGPFEFGTFVDFNIINRVSVAASPFANINLITRNADGYSIGMRIGGGSQRDWVGLGYLTKQGTERFAVNGSGYFNGALTIDGGLITFGANDSAGTGYRILRVPNI